MAGIRDIKRDARLRLHRNNAVPAFYIPSTGATPVPVTVRVWGKGNPISLGDLPGFQGSAERVEPEDRIRFMLSELPTFRRQNAVVSVEAGEAYRIDHWYPVDDQFITARVIRLTDAEMTGLPVPA
jgi:hypothetical protein